MGKRTPPGDYLDTTCGPARASLRNNALSGPTRTSPTGRYARFRRKPRTREGVAPSRQNKLRAVAALDFVSYRSATTLSGVSADYCLHFDHIRLTVWLNVSLARSVSADGVILV
jgi:hypothetical protein